MRASVQGLWVAVGSAMLVAACGAPSGVGKLRYHNQEPVWRVNDRADVPKKPANRNYARTVYHIDGYVVDGLTRILDFSPSRRAADVNSLGEVPDSTWFENRIGVRELSVDEVRRGPNRDAGPEPHKPWSITGTKVGGMSVGFLMKDARGVKYLLKFDKKAYPEYETASDIIAMKILWACGYHVAEDTIVDFVREDLVIADDAVKKDTMGNKSPMEIADLEEGLAKVYKDEKGHYRGLVSKYLPGIPIAGYPRGGVRGDDANDTIAHQLRRSLRGQTAIFAWLNHTDLQEDNTLDVWETDPDNPDKHYVVHYLIDFGKALGVMAYLNRSPTVGFAHLFDIPQALRALVSFGLWKRDWESQARPNILGVGLYESRSYHPGRWKANSPYWPYKDADRFDAFWGAKIIIRFSPAQLRAAVEEGQFSDPRATEYMLQTLIERQRMTARYWFGEVNPLDGFTIGYAEGGYKLCFDDLLLRYDLYRGNSATSYSAVAYGYDGRETRWRGTALPDERGHACVTALAPGPSHDGYLIVKLATGRGKATLPATEVHLATDPATGKMRVIGIRRR